MARRVPPRASRWSHSTVTSGTWFLLALSLAVVPAASAQQKRIYVALDDHTDYMWTADEVTYRAAFLNSLDYYLNLADSTAGNAPEFQSRFNTDGSFWMWEYEKNKPAADFDRLIGGIRSGHITVPLNALVSTYGAQPTEAVLRGMYYPGQIERRYDLRFPLVEAMENQTLPLGLSSLWAGAGGKYSWKGVCGCATSVTNLNSRPQEIYRYTGLDGRSITMKWNSLFGNSQSIGGYAEARDVTASVNFVDTNSTFIGKYPYSVIGAFGKGWDDLQTQTNQFVTLAPTLSNSSRKVIVSNEVDFFTDFDATYGSASLPSLTRSYGNEWDPYSASLAEVSSSVRRSVEKLRGAEGLATLVSLVDPAFWTSRKTARDQAWMDLGLYWEHDWTADGPVTRTQRATWQRRLASEISSYVDTLQSDAVSMMGALIPRPAATERFFVFNPLSWARDDIAEIPRSDTSPIHVVDVSSGTEVPSQLVTVDGEQRLRVLASAVPPVGYKVFEIVPGAGTTFSQAATVAGRVLSNGLYQVTIADRGAITSLVDLRRGNREFAATVGGSVINDLGSATGALAVENAGPVSVTLKATSSGPISHQSRITLLRGLDRIEIRNDITQNFSDVRTWAFGFNLTNPDVRHEELGAVLRAKLLANGGHYSPVNARYSWLTLNHFADMTEGAGTVGVTLSNADTSFMRLGSSTPATLDTTTPQISPLAGGQVDGTALGIQGQGGDTHFLQRFALRTHDSYDQASAMRFALEHQNPFVTGTVTGGTGYPGDTYSFLTISDPRVLLWAMKPAEEGIDQGVIARVWNLGTSSSSFALNLAPTVVSANQTTHIETVIGPATVTGGALAGVAPGQGMVTYSLQPGSGSTLPVADGQSVTTKEDTAAVIVLTGSEPGGGALTYAVVTGPAHGALSGTAPSLTYTPTANYNGPDSFTFRVTDPVGAASAAATVSITVSPVNDPPVANAQSVSVGAGGSVAVTLTGSDVDGDPLTFAVVSSPAHGSLSGTPPTLTYTPTSGYSGADSFTFKANDGTLASNIATISVTVSSARPAWWNAAWTQRRKLVFNAAARTANLVNFPLLVKLDASRIDYSATGAGGADLRFVDADGVTVLSHEIEQWTPGGTSTAWVKVPQIDAGSTTDFIWLYYGNPAAADGQNRTGVWSGSYRGVWHLTDLTDATGNGHTGNNVGSTTTTGRFGSARRFDGVSGHIVVPNASSLSFGLSGSYSLSAWVQLGPLAGKWIGVAVKSRDLSPWYGIGVNSSNQWLGRSPTNIIGSVAAAVWSHVVVVQDGAANTRRLYVNGVQVATGTAQAANGTGDLWFGGAGSTTEYMNGVLDEVRLAGLARPADWVAAEYLSETDAFVTYVVDTAAAPPSIATSPASQTVTAGQTATFSVVANGTAPLSYQWQRGGANIAGATASAYTTPATTLGDTGAIFRCVVSNSAGSATSASATLTVQPANQPPTANGQAVTANENATKAIVLTGSDPEGGALTYAVVTGPAHGALSGTAPSLTYTPSANYTGSDSFTFKVTDPVGAASAAATVSITVNAGSPPVISAVAATNVQSTSATITWTTNVASSSQVDYGTTTAYGTSTTLDSTLLTTHSQGISALVAGTLYHYRVRSGASGGTATSPDATFTTAAVLVGDTKVETGADGNAVGLAEAFQYTATTTGTAGKVVVYLDSTVAANRVTVGLYTDNATNPGTLLAQATVTTVTKGAWNTIALPAASITSGTKYWIAILSPTGSAGAVAFRDHGAGTKSVMCSTTNLAALPATWTSGTAYSNSPMSAYVTR